MSSSDVARAAAQHLTDLAPTMPELVEARLQTGSNLAPGRFDPTLTLAIALTGLLVNTAGLAWKIYWDLKSEKAASAPAASPTPEVIARRIRIAVEVPPGVTDQQRNRVISVVVDETIKQAKAD
jgi:hypothetical protein